MLRAWIDDGFAVYEFRSWADLRDGERERFDDPEQLRRLLRRAIADGRSTGLRALLFELGESGLVSDPVAALTRLVMRGTILVSRIPREIQTSETTIWEDEHEPIEAESIDDSAIRALDWIEPPARLDFADAIEPPARLDFEDEIEPPARLDFEVEIEPPARLDFEDEIEPPGRLDSDVDVATPAFAAG